METGNIAIIGGTGFECLPSEIFTEPMDIMTAHGPVRVLSVSDNYTEPYKLYFLPRHGPTHGLAPHQINYRANTLALRELGVQSVFATNAVGSLRTDLAVGSFIVIDDFIDFAHHRPHTLFDNEEWRHTDFSAPYNELLRRCLLQTAERLEAQVEEHGTYICCDGPRFESPAEIRMFRSWGGDVIGMTGIPEVVFAREAGMDYAALAVVTNFGAGLTAEPVSHEDVAARMQHALPQLRELTMGAARLLVELRVSEADS